MDSPHKDTIKSTSGKGAQNTWTEQNDKRLPYSFTFSRRVRIPETGKWFQFNHRKMKKKAAIALLAMLTAG
ncbi:hypothetical protein, partial [uncultured Bacteroides sp.]|uniref:hypothetical protein n=1 Tax=uncultured Bacteroides sp. TaxID=162156 RepID=UPI0027320F24